ncbi:VOC family protein [Endozoicomonas lisbonensis]|uniref:Enzyme related to lactoylglutathione lyase n=1 Tax=Endozoicomonas lisbonensis TaxID=3120522 RepID=A0ABV2SEG4_9GAMM
MLEHEKLDYVEFPSSNLSKTKDFFTSAFGWAFEDFGQEYIAFMNQGLNGGFYKSELKASTENGSALLIFYSDNLEKTQEKIERNNGVIVKSIFSFPGGRRFHFTEPSGNEFAVWSDK